MDSIRAALDRMKTTLRPELPAAIYAYAPEFATWEQHKRWYESLRSLAIRTGAVVFCGEQASSGRALPNNCVLTSMEDGR